MTDAATFLPNLRTRFRRRAVSVELVPGEFPQLHVGVPASWREVQLAPLYDVHLGHKKHDASLFRRHLEWLTRTPNVISFNGGDLIDNSSKLSVGGGVYEQLETPDEQVADALETLAGVRHKLLFALPGNHEARSGMMGLDLARWIATQLEVPYFPDYCIAILDWRGQHFRLLAHHGSGAAQTAGAQRMAARKDLAWFKADLYWTGHLHSPLVDVVYQTDVVDGKVVERNAFSIISPSYLGFFGTYAAAKRLPPGTRGLAAVTLQPDGRIDASLHARGVRT